MPYRQEYFGENSKMIFVQIVFFALIASYFWFNRKLFENWICLVFSLKSIAALFFVWIYTNVYVGDLTEYLSLAKNIKETEVCTFLFSDTINDLEPRKTFFSKIFLVLYTLSFKNIYLIAISFNTLSFLLIFESYKFLKVKGNEFKNTFFLAFLFPSVLFWVSGITKESIALPCFLYVLLLVYHFKKEDFLDLSKIVLLVLSIYVISQLRYFYLPFLLLFVFAFVLEKMYKKFYFWFVTLCLLSSYFYFQTSLPPQAQIIVLQELIYENYHAMVRLSGNSDYLHLSLKDSSLSSIVLAFCAALKGVFFITKDNVFSLLISVENIILFIFLLISLYIDKSKNKAQFWIFTLLLILQGGFFTLVSPNYGSLSRYRVIYWFFLVWYVLEQQKSLPFCRRLFDKILKG